jgi:adenylate cyclase
MDAQLPDRQPLFRSRARRPLRWSLPLLAAIGFLALQFLLPAWADRLEAWTVDARFALRRPEPAGFPIVIVALDEASFQRLGDLQGENLRTWPRGRWAALIDRINAGRPRVIGLDVVFDTPGWDPGGDEALAAALASAGNVVLPAHLDQVPSASGTATTVSPPAAPLAASAAAVGLATFPTDADGAVRRLTLLTPWGGQLMPAYALAVATLYRGEPLDVPASDLADDLSLPLCFRGPEGIYPAVSVADIWLGEFDPQHLADAIVLIGYTTQLEQDRHLAPFGGARGLPGVVIQANAVDTLLSEAWLHRPPSWLTPLLMALGALLAGLLLNLPRPTAGLLGLLGLLTAYVAVSVALFVRQDLILPIVSPVAATLAVGAVSLSERMVLAEREKRLMRQRFAGIMSPERLQAVMENWEALLDPGRHAKEGTVLFADVRNFTRATERLMHAGRSREMVAFLGAYLDHMAAAIFSEGGVIHLVMGDGLLILFGLPEPLPDHALSAVRAAVRMAAATQRLQHLWPLRDESPFGMGIGVHCGLIADAIIGRGRRLDYAVIGDAVNTAARIESHCKASGNVPRSAAGTVPPNVEILISAALYDRVRDRVLVDQSIPPFEARGKSQPLEVVRLLGLVEGPE